MFLSLRETFYMSCMPYPWDCTRDGDGKEASFRKNLVGRCFFNILPVSGKNRSFCNWKQFQLAETCLSPNKTLKPPPPPFHPPVLDCAKVSTLNKTSFLFLYVSPGPFLEIMKLIPAHVGCPEIPELPQTIFKVHHFW